MSKIYELLKSRIGMPVSPDASRYGFWLHGTLRKISPDSLTVEFLVKQEMTNLLNMLHGGVIAGMIDDSLGMTVAMLNDDKKYVSVSLNVDFLSGAQLNDKLFAVTTINRIGNTIINAECEIKNNGGKLIAKGTANFMQIFPKK